MRPTWPQAAAPQLPADRIIKEVKMGIHVFHQGSGLDSTLWHSYFDFTNSTWQPDTQLKNVGISFAPSTVALPSPAGAIAVFHQGADENGQLWYSYFDGTTWQPDTQVPNVAMSFSPSAVVIPGDGIYVFHQGYKQDNSLWYSHFHFSNSTWDPDQRVKNVGIFDSPSAVALPSPAGAISVFHQGTSQDLSSTRGDGQLWYSYFDGTTWQPDTQVPNVGMCTVRDIPFGTGSGAPSAVVIPGDGIYVFHQGIDNVFTGPSGELWYSHFHFDNSTWDPDKQVPNFLAPAAPLMSQSPSAVALPSPAGAISAFYQGISYDGQLCYSYWDGTNWAPQVQVLNVGMSKSPSAVVA
jgi:hypothetical protein